MDDRSDSEKNSIDLLLEAKKFEKNLLNYFRRQGVSSSQDEDLVQETYLRLWNYRDRYVPTAKLSTFLFTLARQVRIDALRAESRRLTREKDWAGDRPDTVGSSSVSVDAREDVRWALAQLSSEHREVIEFGVFQDLPYAEIAEILEIPLGTVKSRMFNALKKLKEIFDDRRS